jgi:mannose-6-phosphate isomerase-like protein (cupin superfamily)
MRIIKKSDIKIPFEAPSGEVIYEMIGSNPAIGGTVKHSFVHVSIPINGHSDKHYHKVSEETYYILSGFALITIDDSSFFLEKDKACLIMPNEVHQIFNGSANETLEFLTVSAPAWTPDDSFFIE